MFEKFSLVLVFIAIMTVIFLNSTKFQQLYPSSDERTQGASLAYPHTPSQAYYAPVKTGMAVLS